MRNGRDIRLARQIGCGLCHLEAVGDRDRKGEAHPAGDDLHAVHIDWLKCQLGSEFRGELGGDLHRNGQRASGVVSALITGARRCATMVTADAAIKSTARTATIC